MNFPLTPLQPLKPITPISETNTLSRLLPSLGLKKTPMTVSPNMSTANGPARGNADGTITYNSPQGAYTPPIPKAMPTTTSPSKTYTPMTVAPNMSTPTGPARGNMDGSVTYNSPQGAYTIPKAPVPNSTPYTPATAGSSYIAPSSVRPTMPSVPAPSSSPALTAPSSAPAVATSSPSIASAPATSSGQPINTSTGGVVGGAPIVPTGLGSFSNLPKTSSSVESALKDYNDAQKLSPEEEEAQKELDKQRESARMAYNNIEDKAIPMSFITGQLASVERRAVAQEATLEQRLARMQAKRQAALESSKFALERADKAAEGNKPITLGKDQTLVQRDASGNYQSVFGGQPIPTGAVNPVVDSWVKLIAEGKAKLSDVPNDLLNQVASGLGNAPVGADPKAQNIIAQADTALTSIDTALKLLNDPNSANMSETAVGRTLGQYIPGSSAANLEASLDTVRALVGFDTLQKMREASPTGGALGAISERELGFLQSVQGSLSSAQSTEQLTATINRIKQSFQTLKLISSPEGVVQQVGADIYVKTGPDQWELVPAGFNQVGGDTQQASRPVRNNNPLNIKASSATSTYNGVAGLDPSPASDGGQFLVFESPEAGFDAAKRLIQTEGYRNLTVDAALRRWSNNGYGASMVPQLANKTIAQLTSPELDSLIQAMARNEGYYA